MLRNRFKTLIAACGFLLSQTLSANIIGIGYAPSYSEAKKEALSDLSQNIKSEVRSNFESTTKQQNQELSKTLSSNIIVKSNLPILGADFTTLHESDTEAKVQVKLQSSKSIPLYKQQLVKINSQIDSLLGRTKNEKNKTALAKEYEGLYSLLAEFERYQSVIIALGYHSDLTPAITQHQLNTYLEKLSASIDSLDMAAQILSKDFKEKNIYIYPPLLQNSSSVTEFGSIFQKKLQSKLSNAKDIKSAHYFLSGEYILAKQKMILNYRLLDITNNEVLSSKTITLNSKAYKNFKVKPQNIDFDMLLNSGIVSSSDLKVSLSTNKGSSDLLFKNSEEVEIFVKLNKMGYLYIVGYSQNKDNKLAYLLELQEGEGNSRFVKFVNADDASRWISLGRFSVESPFGIESLQVIASNKPITSLPHAVYNERSGYYEISKDTKKTILQTRGLKKKISKKAEFSEDVLTFTTMKN